MRKKGGSKGSGMPQTQGVGVVNLRAQNTLRP